MNQKFMEIVSLLFLGALFGALIFGVYLESASSKVCMSYCNRTFISDKHGKIIDKEMLEKCYDICKKDACE